MRITSATRVGIFLLLNGVGVLNSEQERAKPHYFHQFAFFFRVGQVERAEPKTVTEEGRGGVCL